MPLAHPAADVWTLLADIAEETPDAPAFLHGAYWFAFSTACLAMRIVFLRRP